MATFPPVASPAPAAPQPGVGQSAMRIAMFYQLAQQLAAQNPQIAQEINQILPLIRQMQAKLTANTIPSQPAAPPM
jgi:hypothetical protein